MPTLYIAEFEDPLQSGVLAGVVRMPPVTEKTVAIGATSAVSAAFAGTTKVIRVHADQVCSIAVGANPTASATNMRLAAGQTEYFWVNGGDKIAVITNA